MKKLKHITVLPGDGIGPEVINQAIKVLNAIREKYGNSWEYRFADIGSVAIDKYHNPFPRETYEACITSDAILMGAIGHPKYDHSPSAKIRPEQGLLAMRKALKLFSNIRPLRVHPRLAHMSPVKEERLKGVDFVVFRELTGGIYFGEKKKGKDFASDLCYYSRKEIERVAKLAFKMASSRNKKLTLVDKANVLESSRLWREVVQKLSRSFPEIKTEYLFVDNAAMQFILDPAQFDVILCSNLFGDIISDEASVLAGSIGMLPSASRGEVHSLYEPVHGSYHQAAGKDLANPLATILSAEMMLRDFGLREQADEIQSAVNYCLEEGIGTEDLHLDYSCTCSMLGDIIAAIIEDGAHTLRWLKIKEGISTII